MNILKTIRSHEWWEYKLSPLLALGYATALGSGKSLLDATPRMLYILSALVIGAAYVSVINDVTDIDEDLASGKKNRMANIPPSRRWVFPVLALVAGAGYIATLWPNEKLMLLATLPWLSFSCYSIPPIRLKKRGIWGVFADASGSHLFPSIFMVAAMTYYTQQPLDKIWFAAVGIWALAYGLRGILWHQFMDRENDRIAGVKTFATQMSPDSFRTRGRIILAIEWTALVLILWRLGKPLPVVALALYFLFAVACRKWLGIRFISIRMPAPGQAYHILMGDYYQIFFPLSILVSSALVHPLDWIILPVYLFLFAGNAIKLLRYAVWILRSLRARLTARLANPRK